MAIQPEAADLGDSRLETCRTQQQVFQDCAADVAGPSSRCCMTEQQGIPPLPPPAELSSRSCKAEQRTLQD
eukprot:354114-Chlamydomonas_euryale.AAC.5